MISKLSEVMDQVKTVAISAHIRPDGDAVGSSLGMWNYIRKNYPDVDAVVYLEPFEERFSFLPGANLVRRAGEDIKYDLFICLDCSGADRLGASWQYFESAAHTLCVDHHITAQSTADEQYIFPEASSASELVFELLDSDKIDSDCAQCLYTGIASDTGMFQYSSTHRSTMEAAGVLMETGIDTSRIVDRVFHERSFAQTRALGYCFEHASLAFDGQVIVSSMDTKTMESFGAKIKDLGLVVSELRLVKGIKAAVFLYETSDEGEDVWKLSLRANGNTNVANVASFFGGGGHVKAAGATLHGKSEELLPVILNRLKEEL